MKPVKLRKNLFCIKNLYLFIFCRDGSLDTISDTSFFIVHYHIKVLMMINAEIFCFFFVFCVKAYELSKYHISCFLNLSYKFFFSIIFQILGCTTGGARLICVKNHLCPHPYCTISDHTRWCDSKLSILSIQYVGYQVNQEVNVCYQLPPVGLEKQKTVLF